MIFHYDFEIQQIYVRIFLSPISVVLLAVENELFLSYDGKTLTSMT